MNKKTIKIAGWALGLSMAVAGIGAAVGASVKNPMEVSARTVNLEYSFTISTSDFSTASYAANTGGTTKATCVSDNTKTLDVVWVSSNVMQSSSVMQWKKNVGTIYNTTDLGTITSVTINSTAGTFTTKYGDSSNPTTGSATVGNGYFVITVGSATGKTNSVTVTFTKSTTAADYAQEITASASSMREDGSVTLTTNADTATWSIVDGAEYAALSSTSGKIVTLSGANNGAYDAVRVKAVATDYVDATIDIEVTAKPAGTYYDVDFQLTNLSVSGDETNVLSGSDVAYEFAADEMYKLPEKKDITVTGTCTSWNYAEGILSIYGVGSDITVSAEGVEASIASIAVSGQKTAFTLGDEFSFGGTVTGIYDDDHNPHASETINSANYTVECDTYDAFTAGTYPVTVTYSNLSVNYNAVVSAKQIEYVSVYDLVTDASDLSAGDVIVIANAAGTYAIGTAQTNNFSGAAITLTEEDTRITAENLGSAVEWTMSDAGDGLFYLSNDGNYLYAASSSANQMKASDSSSNYETDGAWAISVEADGEASIQATSSDNRNLMRFNPNNGSPIFSCYADGSTTGTALSVFKKKQISNVSAELIRISAEYTGGDKYIGDTVSASDFSVTALYDTGDTATVTANLSIVSGETLSSATNSVELSYTEGNVTKTVTVSGIAASVREASLTGITWNQTGVNAWVGDELDFSKLDKPTVGYSDSSSSSKNLSDCVVKLYEKDGNNYVNGVVIEDGHSFASSDDGKYLGVTYTENEASATAYASAPLIVAKKLNGIYPLAKTEKEATWTYAQSVAQTKDTLVDVDIDSNISMTGNKGTSGTKFRFWTDGIRAYAGNTVTFAPKNGATIKSITLPTVSVTCNVEFTKNGDTYTFGEGTNSDVVFTVSANATIGSDIVVTYDILQAGANVADTNVIAQHAAIEFAEKFSARLDGICAGNSTDLDQLSDAWSGDVDGKENVQTIYANALASITTMGGDADDIAAFKTLIANVEIDETEGAEGNDDVLQDAIRRYNWIVANRHLDDFLKDQTGKAAVLGANQQPAFANRVAMNEGSALAIAAVGVAGVIAAAGFAFLRRKKEDR